MGVSGSTVHRERASSSAGPAGRGAIGRVWSRPGVRKGAGAALGLVLGTALGFYLTLIIFVAQARAGNYIYSLHDLTEIRWQALPTLLGLVGGAALGWRSMRALGATVLGFVAGALVLALPGWFLGPLLWEGRSAPWAGAVLASAVGAVGASVLAYRRWRGGE